MAFSYNPADSVNVTLDAFANYINALPGQSGSGATTANTTIASQLTLAGVSGAQALFNSLTNRIDALLPAGTHITAQGQVVTTGGAMIYG